MNKQIRRLGIALIACYLALFAQLNWIQVFDAEQLNDHPENARAAQRAFNRPRGDIVSADGALLAETVSVDGKAFDRQRRYPEGELFAHTTGYLSFLYGATGLEQSYDEQLSGSTAGQQLRGLTDLFGDEPVVGDLHLSLRKDLQELARQQLRAPDGTDRQGSVVALDPRTGEILAFWSYPSYDPNPLASIDLDDDGAFATATAAWDAYNAAPGKPLLAHQYQERYFPGSTFKPVTAGVGISQGVVTAEEPRYPVERSWTPPLTTQSISNFGGSACGGALFAIMRVSCNTAFARMGVETIGPEGMVGGVEPWGFNQAAPIDLPDPATSVFPTDFTQDLPKLAQSSIGQNDVAASPLQMALVAAGVANEGRIMEPHVVREVRTPSGDVVSRNEPDVWTEPMRPEDAAVLRDAMIGVVEDGTATVLRTPGYVVGGKTGTAQLGTDPPTSHTWMIAFAGPPGDPQVAVAVVVLNQSGARESTGGAVAGPIAKAMIDAVLAVRAAEGFEREPLPTWTVAAEAPPTTPAPAAGAGATPGRAPSTTAPPTTAAGPAPSPTTTGSTAPTTSETTTPPTTAASSTSSSAPP